MRLISLSILYFYELFKLPFIYRERCSHISKAKNNIFFLDLRIYTWYYAIRRTSMKGIIKSVWSRRLKTLTVNLCCAATVMVSLASFSCEFKEIPLKYKILKWYMEGYDFKTISAALGRRFFFQTI